VRWFLVRSRFHRGRVLRTRLPPTPALACMAAHCQWHCRTGMACVKVPGPGAPFHPCLREEARKVTVSNGQQEVGKSLRRLGIPHELEWITADGLSAIDLAIVDRRIALEFDGPSHFTRNSLEPLGHTRLRDRLLWAIIEWAGTLCRFLSSSGVGCISRSRGMPTWSVDCTGPWSVTGKPDSDGTIWT
jgi:hypothetical protein